MQYLTLEEAAAKLGMTVDALREMAKKKTIRAFQDRGSWRFRASDIEEEARKRGINSDPEVALGEAKPKKPVVPAGDAPIAVDFGFDDDDSDEVPLGREKTKPSGPASKAGKSSKAHSPKPGSDSDVRLVLDSQMDFAIDLDEPAPASGPKSAARKKGGDSGPILDGGPTGDSDVKVVPTGRRTKSPSDSDIRLHDSGRKKGDVGNITEEIDLDAEEAKVRENTKKAPPAGGKRKVTQAQPSLPTSSPFELSEPDIDLGTDEVKAAGKGGKSGRAPKPTKDTDSSSEFEMVAFDDDKLNRKDLGSGEIPLLPSSDDEVDLGAEVSGGRAGNSGINIGDVVDSGISLEDGGSDELEFELSLDAGSTPRPADKKAPVAAEDDSSSEFELSLDDSSAGDDSDSEFELSLDDGDSIAPGEGSDSEFELTLDDEGAIASVDSDAQDIFEDTSFDIPGDESGSEAVALDDDDGSSDFEISLDDDSAVMEDSDSQVVGVDDDQADEDAATIAKPRKAGLAGLGKGAKGKAKAAPADDSEEVVVEDDASEIDIDLDEPPAKKGKGAAAKKKPAKAVDVDEDDDEDDAPAGVAPAPEWGALPAVMLFPTIAIMFLVALMGFEVMRSMWGFHKPTPVGKPVIDMIARQFDETLPK